MTCIFCVSIGASGAAASRNVSTASNDEEVTSPTARRILPKWQIVGGKSLDTASKPLQRPVASLKPGSAPQKATLLTKEGPIDVSFFFRQLLRLLGGGNCNFFLKCSENVYLVSSHFENALETNFFL